MNTASSQAEKIKEISGVNPLKCVKPGKLIDAARQLVVRQRGQNYLTADEIPELLDEELPQQLLVSAFRRYRR